MKITKKMADIHDFIKNNSAGEGLANDLQKAATKAIRGGMTSDDWKKYMCYFASNPEQLQRLIGREESYNGTIYGPDTLAYMVANSTCGPGTDTETGRFMNAEMLESLDRDLPSDERDITECSEQHAAVKKYLS